jgi:hypothetical protein
MSLVSWTVSQSVDVACVVYRVVCSILLERSTRLLRTTRQHQLQTIWSPTKTNAFLLLVSLHIHTLLHLNTHTCTYMEGTNKEKQTGIMSRRVVWSRSLQTQTRL